MKLKLAGYLPVSLWNIAGDRGKINKTENVASISLLLYFVNCNK